MTSAARIDQIQPTAMRETLVTAQICPLNFYFSFIDDESLLIRNKSFNQLPKDSSGPIKIRVWMWNLFLLSRFD